jgi:hypothetical protein
VTQESISITEREFLIKFGVAFFNGQYGRNIDPAVCDIRSIDTGNGSDISYEINTNRTDDHVRLRMHLRFAKVNNLTTYRLDVDGSGGVGTLADEVFVTTGTIDQYYKDSGMYKFAPIINDEARLPAILTEDGTALFLENGDFLELEGA